MLSVICLNDCELNEFCFVAVLLLCGCWLLIGGLELCLCELCIVCHLISCPCCECGWIALCGVVLRWYLLCDVWSFVLLDVNFH